LRQQVERDGVSIARLVRKFQNQLYDSPEDADAMELDADDTTIENEKSGRWPFLSKYYEEKSISIKEEREMLIIWKRCQRIRVR
jgi:hypothetical protein